MNNNNILAVMGVTEWRLRPAPPREILFGNLSNENGFVGILFCDKDSSANAEKETELLSAILKAFGLTLELTEEMNLNSEPNLVITFGPRANVFPYIPTAQTVHFSFPHLSTLLDSPEQKKLVWQQWLAYVK